jgi:hypothetical protein
MIGSMWLLTATCLACGAPDSATVAPAQSGPAPLIIQSPNPGSQDPAKGTGAHWYGATPAAAHAPDCTSCDEHPGFLARLFSRLRSFFSHCHSDSCCEGVAKCETGRPSLCDNSGDCDQHVWGLRERLARLFHRPCSEDPCCTPAQPTIVQMLPPTAVLPPVQRTASLPPAAAIQPVSTVPARPVPAPALEIAKEYLHKVANAEDYSWVTGQLFYIHIHSDQGLWFVRYAPVDKEDRYGGSVVLASATSMANFREGDLVTVHGEILNQGRGSRYLGGPLYRALAVELRERARP